MWLLEGTEHRTARSLCGELGVTRLLFFLRITVYFSTCPTDIDVMLPQSSREVSSTLWVQFDNPLG